MVGNLIDGKALAAEIRASVAQRAAALRQRGHVPTLATVMIGDDPAAASYARSQARHAESVGIEHRIVSLPQDATLVAASAAIAQLNADSAVGGILLQMPVPAPLDGFALQQMISPAKDVEGVGARNLGLLTMGREALVPCTAAAAFACLNATGVNISGVNAVVVGRSVIVGKPMALLLLGAHATVTQCHTRTRDLSAHTRRAEVLMVAAGVAGLIGAEHISPGTIVIDVGTHRIPDAGSTETGSFKIVGDVRFEEVAPIAKAITPVPGGVGPVTVAMLLLNAVTACERAVGTWAT